MKRLPNCPKVAHCPEKVSEEICRNDVPSCSPMISFACLPEAVKAQFEHLRPIGNQIGNIQAQNRECIGFPLSAFLHSLCFGTRYPKRFSPKNEVCDGGKMWPSPVKAASCGSIRLRISPASSRKKGFPILAALS